MTEKTTIDFDISGFVLPEGPGKGVDQLKTFYFLSLREKVARYISEAKRSAISETEKQFLSVLEAFFQQMPFHLIAAVFDHPFVSYILKKKRSANGNLSTLTTMLAGFIPGTRSVARLNYFVNGEHFPREGFFLPHLNILVRPFSGVLAISIENGLVRLTWPDGYMVSSFEPPAPNGYYQHPRLFKGRYASFLPVLNQMQPFSDQPFYETIKNDLSDLEVRIFEEGLGLLAAIWPLAYQSVRKFYRGVIFLQGGSDFTRSLTTSDLPGGFLVSVRDQLQIADALTHEVSHLRMNYLLEYDPILENDEDAVHPSPWRKDTRPMIGIFNGVHAFLNVYLFYQRVLNSPYSIFHDSAARIMELQGRKLKEGWDYLRKNGKPTPVGVKLFEQMETVLAGQGLLQKVTK